MNFRKAAVIIFMCGMKMLAFGDSKKEFPSFRCPDLLGRTIDSCNFRGHYTYVHFVKSPVTLDKEQIINNAIQEFKNNRIINILFILPNGNMPKIDYLPSNIFFLDDKEGRFHNQFEASSCCESFFIYNELQELMLDGVTNFDYKTEARPYLIEILKGTSVRFFDADFRMQKIRESGLPSSLSVELNRFSKGKNISFVGMLSNACSACPIAEIIKKTNRYFDHLSHTMSFIVFLADDFTDIDIGNFQSTFSIRYTVLKSPPEIAKIWNRMRSKYPRLFDNIFLIINKKGDIEFLFNDINNFTKYMDAVYQ
jgi:hypothetical protein